MVRNENWYFLNTYLAQYSVKMDIPSFIIYISVHFEYFVI